MKIERKWSMPNRWTFKIKPIKDLLNRYVGEGMFINGLWVDPFAGKYSPAQETNDLNPEMPTKSHLEAIDYCKSLDGQMFDGALFDPPYSLRQIMECYKGIGKVPDKVWATTKFYSNVKNELAKRIKIGGYAISFGWNSIGFGKKRGFEIEEILLVSHGRLHNDTIVTVEKKIS